MSPQSASIGARIGAALVDLVLVAALFVLLGILFDKAETTGTSASINLTGVIAGLFFGLSVAYFWLTEARSGRTLGKALLHLRVVGTDGAPLGLGRSALRTLLRIIDGLPVFYLVGFVTLLVTGERRQRLGDLAARSVVTRG